MNREEFEAKPEWRATLKKRQTIYFVLEGSGNYEGRFYEYPEDWISRAYMPIETEMHMTTIRRQLEAGMIELLKGTIPS